jgi:phage terminase large subunit
MQGLNRFSDARWYKSDPITYTFETGSKIEFFSIDQPRKVRGPRRDRLFINEANNTPFESFEQLEIRTKEFVILDYNPTNEFWAHTEIIGKRDDAEMIVLTYLDNEALEPAIRESLERRKIRPGWWKVYGLGQLGEIEGKIYSDWQIIDEIPHEARLLRYGLDFGYTNDPTALVAVYKFNNGYILDEILYQKGMSNVQIKDALLANKQALVIADSAEPKSIDEIKSYGVPIIGTVKGKDSVKNGIQFVQEQRISITKRSINIIREYRNYLWETDRDGKVLNVPEVGYDHTMDAIRYAIAHNINYKPPAVRWITPEYVNPAV